MIKKLLFSAAIFLSVVTPVLAVQVTVPSGTSAGLLLQSLSSGNWGLAQLIAGTNVTISSTTNAITISASGGTSSGFGEAWKLDSTKSFLIPTTTVGVIVNASSTIGGGTNATGLTINGGATTTGTQYFTGITASRPLYVDSTGKLGSAGSGTSGNCVNWGANNTFGDAGSACGSGGGSSGFGEAWALDSTKSFLIPTTTVGIIVSASSTIGSGSTAGGLTVNGNSTTTLTGYIGSRLGIGTVPTTTVALDVLGDIREANTRTDATNKAFRFRNPNFTNAQNDFLLVFGQSKSTANTLILGGGQAGFTAASSVAIFTGAGNNTDTGTNRLSIDSTGITTISNLTGGVVDATTAGALYNTATSTATISSGLGYSGTWGSFIDGSSGSLTCNTASGSVFGCLSSADWTTFNGKQAAGNYITALTGDVTASGPGSVAATLATVNGNVGSFGGVNSIPSFTVNGKGLITAAAGNVPSIPASEITSGTFGSGNYTFPSNVIVTSLEGVGTTSPFGAFAIHANNGSTFNGNNLFVIGSSTQSATTTLFAISNTGSTTASNGINLTAGCYALGGACLTAGAIGGGSTQAVNWATTAVLAGTPTYNNGTAGVGGTLTEIGTGALSVDSNSPAAGDRVLVKNQASAFQNGIYTVTATGSGIASYILTRATDYNNPTEITPGINTYVLSGTANTDTTWAVSFTPPLVIGTNSLTYTESAGTNGTVTSVAASVPSFLSISGSPVTTSGTLAISYSGTALPLANGGTAATGFTTSGNGVYYNGSALVTAPLTSAVTYPYASTTVVTSTTASTTNLIVSGVRSALHLGGADGTVSAYGGAAGCTNQVVTAISAAGATTCTTVSNAMLTSSTISGVSLGGTLAALTATNGTLTFSGSYDGTTARTVGLNLGNANIWTALQQFANASSTQFSATRADFGGTATSTFTALGTFGIGSTTPFANISVATGTILVAEFKPVATSTTQTVNWLGSTQTLLKIGTAGVTISFSNAAVGQTQRVITCAPDSGTMGTITWPAGIRWAGGTAPVQTTTAQKCDVYSFIATQATSTTASAIFYFGAASSNF